MSWRGPAAVVLALALPLAACGGAHDDWDLDLDLDLSGAFDCFDGVPNLLSEHGVFGAHVRCPGWSRCSQAHVPDGMRIELELRHLPGAELSFELEGAVGSVRVRETECDYGPIAAGSITFQTPGTARLYIRDGGDELDRFRWEIEEPIDLQIDVPGFLNPTPPMLDRDSGTLTSMVGQTFWVGAAPVGERGKLLGSRADVYWHLEAPGVATILGGGEPSSHVEIRALAEGEVLLHVEQGELATSALLRVLPAE